MVGIRNRARKRVIIYVAFLTRSIDGSTFSRRSVVSWPAFRAPYAKPKEDGQVPCADHDEAHILLDIMCTRKDESGKILVLAVRLVRNDDSFK